MTNSLSYISLAYKAVATQLLVGEINFISDKLDLPTPHPIEIQHLTGVRISPPNFGFGGSLGTTYFSFAFGNEGKMHYLISKTNHMERFDLYQTWANTPSLISSNEAYSLGSK